MSMMITKLRVSSAAAKQEDYQRGVERLKKTTKKKQKEGKRSQPKAKGAIWTL